MSDAYYGEIRIFGGNYAPESWMFCAGQPLPIGQFTALFAVIGTLYGGDGRTTFNLPDLRGFTPLHTGGSTGPGLSPHQIGRYGGYPVAYVSEAQMPTHTHSLSAYDTPGTLTDPAPEKSLLARAAATTGPAPTRKKSAYAPYDQNTAAPLNYNAVSATGSAQTVTTTNFQPFLACNFIMCVTDGIFPTRG